MKYCGHKDNDGPGRLTCEEIAVAEFRYRYPATTCVCSDPYCPLTRDAREGVTTLCQRHYDMHKGDAPHPDNEIPVEQQWVRL